MGIKRMEDFEGKVGERGKDIKEECQEKGGVKIAKMEKRGTQ